MSTKKMKMVVLTASAMVALGFVPAVEAQTEDCGSFAGVGSFQYNGGARWGAAGNMYFPCDDGDYSMGGSTTYNCEIGTECEADEPTGNFGITDNGYCAVQWSNGVRHESEDGGSIAAGNNDIKDMDGDCAAGFNAFLTSHGADAEGLAEEVLQMLEDLEFTD